MAGKWTDEKIAAEVRMLAEFFGHMPTSRELWSLGRNDLAVAITRSRPDRPFAYWADRLELPRKDSTGLRGAGVEVAVMEYLAARGYSVERQSTKAPFDLLVQGRVRVDVKSAKYGEYAHRDGSLVRGHVFAAHRPGHGACDLFVLCGTGGDGAILWRYFVPSMETTAATITITPTGDRYRPYLEAIHLLDAMAKAA